MTAAGIWKALLLQQPWFGITAIEEQFGHRVRASNEVGISWALADATIQNSNISINFIVTYERLRVLDQRGWFYNQEQLVISALLMGGMSRTVACGSHFVKQIHNTRYLFTFTQTFMPNYLRVFRHALRSQCSDDPRHVRTCRSLLHPTFLQSYC